MRNQNFKLRKFTRMEILGLRLFVAALFLAIGNNPIVSAIGAMIALFMPASFKFSRAYLQRLATGATAEEQEAALLEKIEKKMKTLVEKADEGKITKERLDKEVDKLNKEIAKLASDSIDKLKQEADKLAKQYTSLEEELKKANDALIAQSAEIKKLKESGASQEQIANAKKSFRQAVKEAFMEHKDRLFNEVKDSNGERLSMKEYFGKMGNRQTPEMTIKAPVDMLQSNIVGNNVNNVRLTDLDPQRVSIPLSIYPHVLDIFPVKGINKPYMSLLVVYSYENGADTKVEGAASGKSSFLLKTVEFKAFYIATHFVLSDETLDDLEEALDEISIVAPDKIHSKIDGKIIRATGDDASDIKGILHADKSTPYATVLGATVSAPYIVDVVADAKLQCENNKYRPNVVVLNQVEVAKLAAKKNTFEDSKNDKRVTYDALGNPVAVCGLRILVNTDMADNSLIVLDINQTMIGRRRDMTMEIGYNGTDMTEGQKTVVIKIRVAFGVRDKAAIIYVGSVSEAITGLTQP